MIKEIEVGGVRHSIQAENTIKVTWAELKALRDEAKLNAGTFYRITDYVTTTTQEETKSANHPFDVIVLALSENTLCEDAKAILHESDTYFADSDLSAWELKYCLDNDKTRFDWADEANGKGVIFRMIDEKQNDCPYDFKNILIYNTTYTDSGVTSDKYYYTFSYVVNKVLYDGTTEAQVKNCYGNSMKEYKSSGKVLINKNVFKSTLFGTSCRYNTLGTSCYSNTFGNSCYSNTFGNSCDSNTFGNGCYSNTFGNYCNFNTFDNSCYSNTFGNYCNSNTFGNYCNSNTFGNSCDSNTFGNGCVFNTFDNSCYSRKLEGAEKTFITLSEEFYDDGSGQVVPVKHPDLSTQPSILPYKFMGQYVYEQLLMMMNFDNIVNSKQYHCSELGLFIKDNPLILEASLIINSEQCTFTAPLAVKVESDTVSFVFNIQNLGDFAFGNDSLVSSEDMCIARIVYTSMPEEGDYYGYNNY